MDKSTIIRKEYLHISSRKEEFYEIIAQQVYDMIQQLVQLSQKQAEEIAQISDGIKNASGLLQMNSATAEESAATSRELSDQAQTMKDMVAHFKTK